MTRSALIEQAELAPQSFGIAMAQCTYGGPRGIWLECACGRSDVIRGSRFAGDPLADLTDAEAAAVFRRHGWMGEGDRMLRQRCPKCSGS